MLADRALPQLVSAATTLTPSRLRVAPDQIALGRLVAARQPLSKVVPIVEGVRQRVASTPGSWLGPVSHGRNSLLDQLDGLADDVHDIAVAAELAPPMLGDYSPRRYLIAFMGNTEVRGAGGILGAFALIKADGGRLTFVRYGSDVDLLYAKSDVDVGSDFDDLYSGDDATERVMNADISPHFPYAGQIWSAMAERTFGLPIDGVVAVDPEFLAELLAVTGPVSLSDGTRLTSANLVQELDVDVYKRFNDDTDARKEFFIDAAQSVVHAAFSRHPDMHALLHAFVKAADQRRLQIYSATPSEESALKAFSIGGVLPATSRPFVDVVLNNSSATKLDGYVHEAVTYQRESCEAGPASVTVALTSEAPTSGLPSYMTDGIAWPGPHVPGSDWLLVGLYGTAGSLAQRVTVDGKPAFVATGDERGHPVVTTLVLLPPGGAKTVTFYVDEPAATGPTMVLRQPLANEPTVHVNAPSCSVS